jgi:hypothetical protein
MIKTDECKTMDGISFLKFVTRLTSWAKSFEIFQTF